MKEKQKIFNILNFEKVMDNLTKFLEIKLEIYELKAKSQLVDLIAQLSILGLIISFSLFLLFFSSLALGSYLNTIYDSKYLGYIIISLLYLLICILLILFKGRIIRNHFFRAFFIDNLTHDQNEGDDIGQD